MGYLDAIERLKMPKLPAKKPWLSAWRELAQLTYGIESDGPRFGQILSLMDQCDRAFAKDDWLAFQVAARDISNLVEAPKKRAKAS